MLLGQGVQARRVRLQQRSHLIDECSCTARTGRVHPLLDTSAEIDNLGVLAAQLDSGIALGDQLADRLRAGDDLLHKRDLAKL
ncbi:hypothetical protein D3C75_840940 [compost metagenome]